MEHVRFFKVSGRDSLFVKYLCIDTTPKHIIFISIDPYTPYPYSGEYYVIEDDDHVSKYSIPYESCWYMMESNGEDFIQAGMDIVKLKNITPVEMDELSGKSLYDILRLKYRNDRNDTFVGLFYFR